MIPFKDTLGACSAWGDPHIRTFDGQELDVYGVGKYVFVRFEEVEITVPDNYFDPGAAQSGIGSSERESLSLRLWLYNPAVVDSNFS